MMGERIVILGCPGSGKSTLALPAKYPDKTALIFKTRPQAEAWLAGM